MTHEKEILEMLQGAGARGINSYGPARRVSLQLPYTIHQLKKKGHVIVTKRHSNGSVTYYLVHSKPGASPVTECQTSSQDYEWVFVNGVATKRVKGQQEPVQEVLL